MRERLISYPHESSQLEFYTFLHFFKHDPNSKLRSVGNEKKKNIQGERDLCITEIKYMLINKRIIYFLHMKWQVANGII